MSKRSWDLTLTPEACFASDSLLANVKTFWECRPSSMVFVEDFVSVLEGRGPEGPICNAIYIVVSFCSLCPLTSLKFWSISWYEKSYRSSELAIFCSAPLSFCRFNSDVHVWDTIDCDEWICWFHKVYCSGFTWRSLMYRFSTNLACIYRTTYTICCWGSREVIWCWIRDEQPCFVTTNICLNPTSINQTVCMVADDYAVSSSFPKMISWSWFTTIFDVQTWQAFRLLTYNSNVWLILVAMEYVYGIHFLVRRHICSKVYIRKECSVEKCIILLTSFHILLWA